MLRIMIAGGLFMLCLSLTGCCSRGCRPDQGCGRTYWGAYSENPPGCDPCDSCGNFVGHCGHGGTCLSFPWQRCKTKRCGMKLFGREKSCGEASCDSCCEPACGSGEPACGSTGCNCGHEHAVEMHDSVQPPVPMQTPMTYSGSRSRAMNVSYSHTPAAGGCNCKH